MEFTTRAFSAPDLPDCLAIEQAAVRSNHYLADVLDYYTTTRGEFTVVCAEGKPIGIGKLTVLYDNSAWLELLRVHPQYQRQGAGTAIYRRYFEQLPQLGCGSAAMYTGVKNVASAALAQNFGLQKDSVFRGMTCTLADVCLPQSLSQLPTLHPLTPQQAVEQLLPHKEQLGGYLNINHTFYRINEANCRGMASAGWVFGDGERVLVLGSRFQPDRALSIAAAIDRDGSIPRPDLLLWAKTQAAQRGIPRLTAHFFLPDGQSNPTVQEFYQSNGFVQDPSDDVVCTNHPLTK